MHNADEIHAKANMLRQIKAHDRQVQVRPIIRTLFILSIIGMVVAGHFTNPAKLHLATQYGSAVIWTLAMRGTHFTPPTIQIHVGRKIYETDLRTLVSYPYARHQALQVLWCLFLGGFLACVLWLIGFQLGRPYRLRLLERRTADRHISGTLTVSEKLLTEHIADMAPSSYAIKLGSVPIYHNWETQHFALIGTTGSGKTTALRQMLDTIDARGDAALVYDTSGDFIEHYYAPDRGDIILNPLDARGVFWNPFDEVIHPADTNRIAEYLVPAEDDREIDIWLETTRILVANILRVQWQQQTCTLESLLRTIQNLSSEEIAYMVAGTSSARTFAEHADRATGSVLFMLAKTANLLMFLRAQPRDEEEPFSFARYFDGLDTQKGKKPWIFIPRNEAHFEAIKPLMSCWLDCAISAALSRAPSASRRVWFILDEFPDLPCVPNVSRLMAEGRKFGAATVIAFQAIGQMNSRYGRENAEALLGCCNTKLFLRLGDHASCQWASETIGNEEVEAYSVSDALDPKTHTLRKNLSRNRQTRPAILPSEFQLLHHQGYLQLPGLPPAKITLSNVHIRARGPARQPAFIKGDVADTLWGQQFASATSAPDISAIFSTPGPV